MISRERQFEMRGREMTRRELLRNGVLAVSVLLGRSFVRAGRVNAEPLQLDPIFDIQLERDQTYLTPETHFLTVKGDVLVDKVDVKASDNPDIGTLGRTFRTRVEIRAPFGANIHGNISRCDADQYYADSVAEMREKGCLNGCGDLREWHRGDPNLELCQTVQVSAPPAVVVPARAVCVVESPIKPGQDLPNQPIDYEVCAGATVFVPRQSVIQGDCEPVENGKPKESWHDGEEKTGLITITSRDGYWRFLWGGDVYVDPDPVRLLEYAQEMAVLMRSKGCGTGFGCPDGVKILRWPEDS